MAPTIAEILAKEDERPQWLCNPYVVREGITFLHGKTSIGKSPITWEMCRCIAQGIPFLGRPTAQARVLYLEADAAEINVRPRLRLLPEPIGDWHMEFVSGVNICNSQDKVWKEFAAWQALYRPELVVWNTLRQFYQGAGIDSDTVVKVYKAMRQAFPGAGHIVSAHDRKRSRDADAAVLEDEDFSGSAAWRDLATIGLHLVTSGPDGGLRLDHTKSQVSDLSKPMALRLDAKGTRITYATPTPEVVKATWSQAPVGTKDIGKWVAEQLHISRATVFRVKEGSSD